MIVTRRRVLGILKYAAFILTVAIISIVILFSMTIVAVSS